MDADGAAAATPAAEARRFTPSDEARVVITWRVDRGTSSTDGFLQVAFDVCKRIN